MQTLDSRPKTQDSTTTDAWTMADVETRTKRFSDARGHVTEYVSELNAELETIKRQALPRLKELVARAAQREAELRTLLEATPHLFTDPKTQTFHGIKVGFRKGSGAIDWTDDAELVARLKKVFGDESAGYIRTTEKPIARALGTMDASTLKKLGCTVEDTGDVVVIKATDSDVEKIVSALLKGAGEE